MWPWEAQNCSNHPLNIFTKGTYVVSLFIFIINALHGGREGITHTNSYMPEFPELFVINLLKLPLIILHMVDIWITVSYLL